MTIVAWWVLVRVLDCGVHVYDGCHVLHGLVVVASIWYVLRWSDV